MCTGSIVGTINGLETSRRIVGKALWAHDVFSAFSVISPGLNRGIASVLPAVLHRTLLQLPLIPYVYITCCMPAVSE